MFVFSAPTALELLLSINGLALLWCGVRAFSAQQRQARYARAYSSVTQRDDESDEARVQIEMAKA